MPVSSNKARVALTARAFTDRLLALQDFGTVEKRVREHRQLLEVCRTRRPDAAEQALRRHFERTQRAIRKRLIALQQEAAGEGADDSAGGDKAPAGTAALPPQTGCSRRRRRWSRPSDRAVQQRALPLRTIQITSLDLKPSWT